jgi:iron complex transport system substrate-binding protein
VRVLLVLVLVLAAFAAAACGERSEPTAGELSVYPVEVRGAGDFPATLGERPERIAVLAPGAAEILAELGAGDRLVGIPSGVFIPEASGAVELTRPSGLVDVDALGGIDADLVVAAPGNDTEDVGRVLRRSPAALYLARDDSLDGVVRATLELGLLAGEPVRAREVAAGLREQIAEVAARVEGQPPTTVFVDTGLLITVADSSLVADLVRAAGGELVGTEAAGEPIEPCDLVRLDPDLVLTFDDAPEVQTYDFGDCPGADIPAGVDVDGDLVTRAGPDVGTALEKVARILHPDAFE